LAGEPGKASSLLDASGGCLEFCCPLPVARQPIARGCCLGWPHSGLKYLS
jgi:hypothetical protein